jgi:hypothetical protein
LLLLLLLVWATLVFSFCCCCAELMEAAPEQCRFNYVKSKSQEANVRKRGTQTSEVWCCGTSLTPHPIPSKYAPKEKIRKEETRRSRKKKKKGSKHQQTTRIKKRLT